LNLGSSKKGKGFKMRQKTILFVDDETDFVEMMKFQLENEGYIVVSARNGEDALVKLEQIKPDLIVLDINMPKMGGLEFYNRIITQHGRAKYPVLVLTARADLDGLFKEIKAEGFLQKPFEIGDFTSEIKRIFAGPTNPLVFLVGPSSGDNIENIKEVFLSERYDVESMKNLESVKERAKKRKPDFIVFEYTEEDSESEGFLEKITRDKNLKNVPVIAYSYSGFSSDEEKCMDSGAKAYLNSPESYEDFIGAVKKIQLEVGRISIDPSLRPPIAPRRCNQLHLRGAIGGFPPKADPSPAGKREP